MLAWPARFLHEPAGSSPPSTIPIDAPRLMEMRERVESLVFCLAGGIGDASSDHRRPYSPPEKIAAALDVAVPGWEDEIVRVMCEDRRKGTCQQSSEKRRR